MLANAMGLEFVAVTTINSYYFHRYDNDYEDPEIVAGEFEKIVPELRQSGNR